MPKYYRAELNVNGRTSLTESFQTKNANEAWMIAIELADKYNGQLISIEEIKEKENTSDD